MKNDKHLALCLLADGTHARPSDCEPDADGVLRHIYGTPVALREDGEPMTVGQGAVDNMNVEAARFDPAPAVAAEPVRDEPVAEPTAPPADEPDTDKDLEAESAKKYKTREIKGR